jgi:hypothetical protein
MATYTLIEAKTLASSAASVTFSAIPATYTDLVVRLSARSDSATVNIKITFNSDTATNYSQTYIIGDGSAASSGRQSSIDNFNPYGLNASTYTANTFSNAEIYIPSYLVSQNKPIGFFGVTENNATSAYMMPSAGLWRNTAAITSVIIAPNNNNFVSGSSFYLYGISNA